MRNWKTTLAGITTGLATVVKVVSGGGIGIEDITMIFAALGLVAAKDHDVTGGSRG